MTAANLTFYTNPQSRGQIVRWMLEETGLSYETKVVAYGEEMKSPEYLKINPMGKVPAIIHEGQIVTECAAICAYLADITEDAQLLPPIEARAPYYRWLFFAAGPLEAAVTNRAFGFEVPEERKGMSGYGSFDVTMDSLAQAVSQTPYIAGHAFSAADVYVGSQIGWGLEFKTIPAKDEFVQYFERLKSRPAYKKAKDLDNALMNNQ